MEPFICAYCNSIRNLIWDPSVSRWISKNANNVPRNPYERRIELEASGGLFAKEYIPDLFRAVELKPPDKIYKSRLLVSRSDVWFPKYPRVVIRTHTRSAEIFGLVQSSFDNSISKVRILYLDPGNWACVDGYPFFVTHERLDPNWVGNGPWPFIEMCFPNLPLRI